MNLRAQTRIKNESNNYKKSWLVFPIKNPCELIFISKFIPTTNYCNDYIHVRLHLCLIYKNSLRTGGDQGTSPSWPNLERYHYQDMVLFFIRGMDGCLYKWRNRIYIPQLNRPMFHLLPWGEYSHAHPHACIQTYIACCMFCIFIQHMHKCVCFVHSGLWPCSPWGRQQFIAS